MHLAPETDSQKPNKGKNKQKINTQQKKSTVHTTIVTLRMHMAIGIIRQKQNCFSGLASTYRRTCT